MLASYHLARQEVISESNAHGLRFVSYPELVEDPLNIIPRCGVSDPEVLGGAPGIQTGDNAFKNLTLPSGQGDDDAIVIELLDPSPKRNRGMVARLGPPFCATGEDEKAQRIIVSCIHGDRHEDG